MPNFFDKEKHVLHYKNLQLFFKLSPKQGRAEIEF